MLWHALIHIPTGRLLSVGTVVVDKLPVDVEDRVLVSQPDFEWVVWDVATRDFVTRPMPVLIDRLQDLIERPAVRALWQSLSQAQKVALQNGLIWLLGKRRFRGEAEDVPLELLEEL